MFENLQLENCFKKESVIYVQRKFRLFKVEISSFLRSWGTISAGMDPLSQLNPDPKHWFQVKRHSWRVCLEKKIYEILDLYSLLYVHNLPVTNLSCKIQGRSISNVRPN
jgi:hypothetical protein